MGGELNGGVGCGHAALVLWDVMIRWRGGAKGVIGLENASAFEDPFGWSPFR